jgi:tetratricopeptide (TPR) repeat protein
MILALTAALAAAQPAAAIPAAPATTSCPEVLTPDAFVCRALVASKAGDSQAAAKAFEQAASLANGSDPTTARMWAAAGNMWIAASESGKAALALDRALTGNALMAEERGEALLDRARAAETQNDLKMARAKLTEAAQTIGEDPFLWYFSAALAIRENDAATAKTSIAKALTLAPTDPTVLFEAGHVHHFAGDDAAARDYWARAFAADPNSESGKAASQAIAMLAAPAAPAKKP